MMTDRTVHIRACVFGSRFIVTFEPRSIAWPSLEFRDHSGALACAEARHQAHGWTIVDETEEGDRG